jgi:hypothetical protein
MKIRKNNVVDCSSTAALRISTCYPAVLVFYEQLCLMHSQMPYCIVDIPAVENAIFAVKQVLMTPLYFYFAILYSEAEGMALYASNRMGRIRTRWN